ncbi:MAG: flagellar biosynthetic protein FliR [Acidobacteriia bacterium]|nr:flagellar biosynthetic protein FliR [Terriglobia bacterium]
MIEALARLDLGSEVSRFFLVLLRAGGLVVFCPILGADILPTRIRVGLAASLALVMLPLAPSLFAPPSDVVSWTIVAVREMAVGLGLGFAARALFAGIEGAAGLVAGHSGFAIASMVDPLTGDQGAATVLFQNLMATALFLAANLHHVFLAGLRDSYQWLPPALSLPSFAHLDQAVSLLGTRLFTVTVELAAPALVVTFAVDLVLVLVGRALPQIQILTVGYPAKMAAGIVALALLASATGSAISWIGRTFSSDGAALVAALAGR